MLRTEQIKMDDSGRNTLPRTIHVKPHDTTGSLVATPVPTPRATGNPPLAPVDIDTPTEHSPLPIKENFIPVDDVKETFPVEKEEGLVMKMDEKPIDGGMACPFELMGCRKVGKQREIQLHIRDDRHYHSVLMARNIVRLGQKCQGDYANIFEHYNNYWIALEHTQSVVQKYGAQYVFKITDIGKKMYAAYKEPKKPHLLYSDIFETHRYGYKMCAIVSPFGDGSARREYISAFVSLVKGDYDAVLEWPFRCPVTFALKKPGTQETFEKTIDPAEQADAERFERPLVGRNRSFGFQLFCRIDELGEYSIMDDIYLEISVDLSKMTDPKKTSGLDDY